VEVEDDALLGRERLECAVDALLILAAGQRNGAKLPLSALHRQLLEEAEAAGYGERDNSAVIEVFRTKRRQ
jgi:3-hydroxyisobutyrate dehydrogenase-like beta-hydroxyacid dehydrogenase